MREQIILEGAMRSNGCRPRGRTQSDTVSSLHASMSVPGSAEWHSSKVFVGRRHLLLHVFTRRVHIQTLYKETYGTADIAKPDTL